MALPLTPPADLPADFRRAVATLADAPVRPEVTVSGSAAPQRLAPYAVALHAEVLDGDDELATGRLIVLHDPDGQDVWEGTNRLVAYVRAPLDVDIAADPLLPEVGWSWLTDALTAAGASFTAAGGTVTRVASERFGALAEHPAAAEVEIRASWSPTDGDFAPHLAAFSELLCSAAGLPPTPPGVVAIPASRRPRKPRSSTGRR